MSHLNGRAAAMGFSPAACRAPPEVRNSRRISVFYGFLEFHSVFWSLFPGCCIALDFLSSSSKNHVFLRNRRIVALYHTIDLPCGVTEGYFRGVLHCFGRGKTPGRPCEISVSKKNRVKIEKKLGRYTTHGPPDHERKNQNISVFL